MLSLPLMVISAVLLARGEADIRDGGFPWSIAVAAVLLMVFLNGLRGLYRHNTGLLLRTGVSLTFLGLVGMLSLFGGVAVAGLFGLEEPPGILGFGVLGAGVLAVAGLPLGLLILGIALVRERLLATWSRGVPLFLAVLIPAAMIAGGIADDPIEGIIATAWMVLFGLGWAALGFAVWRST